MTQSLTSASASSLTFADPLADLLAGTFTPRVVAPATEAEAPAPPAKPKFEDLSEDLQRMVLKDFAENISITEDKLSRMLNNARKRLCPICGSPGCWLSFIEWFDETY